MTFAYCSTCSLFYGAEGGGSGIKGGVRGHSKSALWPCLHAISTMFPHIHTNNPSALYWTYVTYQETPMSNSRIEMLGWWSIPQRTYRGRLEIRGVYLPLSGGRDGKYGERGGPAPPPPHQPGLISPSWWDVRQKMTIVILLTLWSIHWRHCLLCVIYSIVGGRFQTSTDATYFFCNRPVWPNFVNKIKHNIRHIYIPLCLECWDWFQARRNVCMGSQAL